MGCNTKRRVFVLILRRENPTPPESGYRTNEGATYYYGLIMLAAGEAFRFQFRCRVCCVPNNRIH
jgi:hypothetical protein